MQLKASKETWAIFHGIHQGLGDAVTVAEVGTVQEDAPPPGEAHGPEVRQALLQDPADFGAALRRGGPAVLKERRIPCCVATEWPPGRESASPAPQLQQDVGKARQDVGGGDAHAPQIQSAWGTIQ